MDRRDASPSAGLLPVLDEFEAAGVTVTPDDPAALLEQLKARIIMVVSADPAEFDRVQYERLMRLWNALETEQGDARGSSE